MKWHKRIVKKNSIISCEARFIEKFYIYELKTMDLNIKSNLVKLKDLNVGFMALAILSELREKDQVIHRRLIFLMLY